ncbi:MULTISPECIES: hypothetical protein [Buttiauxella]
MKCIFQDQKIPPAPVHH